MNNRLLLTRCITLLYRESLLEDNPEGSKDLVREALEGVQVTEMNLGINTDREIILALKKTILTMCDQSTADAYEKGNLLQRIRVDTLHDDKLYDAIAQGIEIELSQESLKKNIINLRTSIENHLKEKKIASILNEAARTFNYSRDSIENLSDFLLNITTKLDGLTIQNNVSDPAIVDEVDFSSGKEVSRVLEKAQNIIHGEGLYRTGWQGLNRMFNGGFRPGEIVHYGAIQHGYKSSLALSLFAQIAIFNKPLTKDPNKKPLLLRISFEDELYQDTIFLYKHIKYSLTREPVDTKNISVEEMSEFVQSKLQETGFHIKILRVDGLQWSYKDILTRILRYESEGYNVEVLEVDYLSKVGKAGLSRGGMIGAELGELLARVGGFCASKDILFITPHQLSTEAKMLLRDGLPGDQFVKLLPGRGYWEGNKGLDRIYDLAFFIHKTHRRDGTYLCFSWDKHRGFICNEEDKFFILPFPHTLDPIPWDLDGEDISTRQFPRAGGGGGVEESADDFLSF